MHEFGVRVGFFLPAAVSDAESAEVRRPGDGRLPRETHDRLMSLLGTLDDVELHEDLDFRGSYVRDGRVYTDGYCLNDLDIYFWYCEVDRRVGSYDLEVLKTIAARCQGRH